MEARQGKVREALLILKWGGELTDLGVQLAGATSPTNAFVFVYRLSASARFERTVKERIVSGYCLHGNRPLFDWLFHLFQGKAMGFCAFTAHSAIT
jgi:hypothetical protein